MFVRWRAKKTHTQPTHILCAALTDRGGGLYDLANAHLFLRANLILCLVRLLQNTIITLLSFVASLLLFFLTTRAREDAMDDVDVVVQHKQGDDGLNGNGREHEPLMAALVCVCWTSREVARGKRCQDIRTAAPSSSSSS